jgi:cytochrome c oxidase assembly factor 6
MGFFSSSNDDGTLPAPKISSDGAPIAPDRTQRAKCWEARDAYFGCLDRNGIIDGITEKAKADKECSREVKGFEANCASSWVSCKAERRNPENDLSNDSLLIFDVNWNRSATSKSAELWNTRRIKH